MSNRGSRGFPRLFPGRGLKSGFPAARIGCTSRAGSPNDTVPPTPVLPLTSLVRTHSLKRTKPIIGIVGSIGAGKTTASRLLRELGAGVIDSDQQAHEVLATQEVRAVLVEWWGEGVIRGGGEADRSEIDRSAIARIVFADPVELKRLEALLYPRIARQRDLAIADCEADPGIRAIIMDSPKLFEAGLETMCDAVIMVDADPRARLERLARSRGWTPQEVEQRERQQISLDEKRAKADHVLINDSDIGSLRRTLERLLITILDDFKQRSVQRHSSQETP